MYEYRVPLVYLEPIAELEAVDAPFILEPTCINAGHSDWALTIH